ncbi:MAG: glycosyltransferase family 1 protein [Conexivisphaerales archaeon]
MKYLCANPPKQRHLKMLMNAKVALINNNPLNSGVGRYAYSLYKALSRLIDVEFISWEKELFNEAFNHLRILNVNWLYYMFKLRLVAKKLDCSDSLVHVTNSGYLASIIPAIKQKSNTIVVTVHDLIPFLLPRSIRDVLLRKAFTYVPQASKIIVTSESTKNDFLHLVDIDPKKLKLIYHGVDHDLFKPRDKLEARRRLRLPLDKPIILNVGSEEPRKNIPTLLKSFKRLLSDVPNALLIRVGEGTPRIEMFIRRLELNGKVLYRKASPNEDALYYNVADLLVHPAYYEGFGNPPLEAMSSGLPVIAGNRTSIPEVIGDAGILLNPFDVEGFAYWMREVLTNEDLRAKLSEAGYKRSLSFSWEKCARETLEVYREVLAEWP